jgi:hypothetical protein
MIPIVDGSYDRDEVLSRLRSELAGAQQRLEAERELVASLTREIQEMTGRPGPGVFTTGVMLREYISQLPTGAHIDPDQVVVYGEANGWCTNAINRRQAVHIKLSNLGHQGVVAHRGRRYYKPG